MRDSCFLSIHKNGPRRSSEAVFIFENERFFFIRIFTQTCSFAIKQQSNENDILVCNDASYDAHSVYKLWVCTK